MRQVSKVWGSEKWIENNDHYCLKEMVLFKNACCSYHWHPVKDETFYVVVGEMRLIIGSSLYTLGPGDSKRIWPGFRHTFFGVETCSFIEVSTTHSDADVRRVSRSFHYIAE